VHTIFSNGEIIMITTYEIWNNISLSLSNSIWYNIMWESFSV